MGQCWASSDTLTSRKGLWLLLGFVLIFEGVLSQATGLDEVVDSCIHVYHQSVVINDTLYIDGGIATLSKAGSNHTNITTIPGNLFAIDLKSSWGVDNFTLNRLGHDSLPGSSLVAPKLVRGALYSGPLNDTKIYLFGGTAISSDYAYGEDNRLWTYDTQNKVWGDFYPNGKSSTVPGSLINPASGASLGVPELGLGFWFNGEQDNRTSAKMQGIGEGHRFIDGMVVFDFNSGTAKNISTDAVNGGPGARARGKMVYAPGVGEKGALVLIGGAEKVAGVDSNDWRGTLVPMDEIHIFDIVSLGDESTPNGTWYKQKAVGTIPDPRIDHCLVLVSAQDGSSHNIYMYAGTDGSETFYEGTDVPETLYDDVNILTLPSFQWVRVYQYHDGGQYGMTCNLARQRHMIVLGGAVSADITEKCDFQSMAVRVYDLSTSVWMGFFNASAAPYEVPKPVTDVVGGSSVGGATVVKPVGGFSDPGLASLFSGLSPVTTPGTTSKSSDTSTPHPNTGAIAGGVVGGLAIVGLIFLALFIRRRYAAGTGTGLEEKEEFHGPGEMSGTSANRMLGGIHELPVEVPVQELDAGNVLERGCIPH